MILQIQKNLNSLKYITKIIENDMKNSKETSNLKGKTLT